MRSLSPFVASRATKPGLEISPLAPGVESVAKCLAGLWPRGSLRRIDTRMAQLVLVGPYAIKLRRAGAGLVHASERRRALVRELRLNRRFSPTVYLGVFPVPAPRAGGLACPGWPQSARAAPRTVDWALVMKRLPAHRMLDQAIASGQVCPTDVDRVARRLWDYYDHAPPVRISLHQHLARVEREFEISRAVLAAPPARLASGSGGERKAFMSAGMGLDVQALIDRCQSQWRGERAAVVQRVAGGVLLEGHGDLRPEHVALVDPVELIDCLEFDRRLRCVDPWEELSLLGLMSALSGAAWIGSRLSPRPHPLAAPGGLGPVSAELSYPRRDSQAPWRALRRERPPASLLASYTAQQALIRARLAWAHLTAPHRKSARHWRILTGRYLAYAQAASEGWHPFGDLGPAR
jgi:aminoglycoside phosphotransferase family enzyme